MSNKNTVYRKVLFLAVPMMIQNGITNAVGLVDNLMVGSLGTESMSAVSIAGQLIFVFNLAIFGGLSGPGIYGAQYYGQGNREGFKNIFRLKIWIGLLVTIAGLFVFWLFSPQLLGLYLRGEAQGINAALTLELGVQYISVMMVGLLPFAITSIYSGSIRETGDSMLPMIAGISAVFTDIIFNYVLIYGKFGAPRLEVRGAAIATVISRFVELAVILIGSHANKKKYSFLEGMYRTLKIPLKKMSAVIIKGLPIALNEFLWAGGVAVLTQTYAVRGLNVIAGMNISNAICNLLNVVFIAMGNAVGIIIGHMLGAEKQEEAKKSSVKLMWFTGIICGLLGVILIALSGVFPLLYNTTDEVRYYGRMFIIINALFFPVQGFLNALYFTIRSGGKTLITFLFDSVFTWVVCVSAALVLCYFTQFSIFVIFAIIQALDLVKVIIGYILIKKGIWVNKLVE